MTLYSPISSIYSRRAEQQPFSAGLKSAAASTLSPSVLLLSTSTRSWMGFTNTHISPCGVALLVRNKASLPVSVYSSSYYLFLANMIVFFLPAAGSCILNFYCVASQTPAFGIGLGVMKCSHWGEGTNRQWLQMEFGQWSGIPIQKIDRTLFTNWSLKFQRGESHKCYIRSQRSFDF